MSGSICGRTVGWATNAGLLDDDGRTALFVGKMGVKTRSSNKVCDHLSVCLFARLSLEGVLQDSVRFSSSSTAVLRSFGCSSNSADTHAFHRIKKKEGNRIPRIRRDGVALSNACSFLIHLFLVRHWSTPRMRRART